VTPDEDPVMLQELARQGLRTRACPSMGRRVLIQRNGNVAIDCTAEVHPEVAHARSAWRRAPWAWTSPASTWWRGHRPAAAGAGRRHRRGQRRPRPADAPEARGRNSPSRSARPSSTTCFPPDESGRVPIVGVTGRQHTTAIARLVAWLLHLHGRQVGLACSAGLFLGPRRVEKPG
jgi:cyanophycin synthetase